jgi:hypothetical protein
MVTTLVQAFLEGRMVSSEQLHRVPPIVIMESTSLRHF